MEIERKWLIGRFPAGLPLLREASVRQGYISVRPAVRIRESVSRTGSRWELCFSHRTGPGGLPAPRRRVKNKNAVQG